MTELIRVGKIKERISGNNKLLKQKTNNKNNKNEWSRENKIHKIEGSIKRNVNNRSNILKVKRWQKKEAKQIKAN